MARVAGFVLVVSGLLALAPAGAGELERLPLGRWEAAYTLGSGRAGELYVTETGATVSVAEAAALLADARVILLGEEHTSIAQKELQARLLEAIAARVRRPVLGMEFFQRGDDEILGKWTSGELSGDEFLLAANWYDRGGYNWGYYAPVMAVARARHMQVVGLNVDRSIPRTVSRGGLDALTPEQRSEVGTINVGGSPQHRYLIQRYFGDAVAMMPAVWLDRMYAAQCLWDVVMARSIVDKLPEDGTMVVVVGTGHVAFGLGIARRIHEELAARGEPDIQVATFCPVTAPAPDPEGEPHGHPMGDSKDAGAPAGPPALFARSYAGLVGVFADTGGVEAYPRIGLKLEEEEGAIVVKRAWPDSGGAEAGVKKGDRILDLNGREPVDIHHLRLALARLRWGDRLDLRVEREGETVLAAALLEPELTTSETSVAPGWEVTALPGFDPKSEKPIAVSPEVEAAAATRSDLVTQNNKPLRVEVRRGQVLAEVHLLGDDGRVARSRYRDPRADGAVEVVYHRGAGGAIESVTRRDRAGRPLGGS